MSDARCHFCNETFRNRQAVRAHLRHCKDLPQSSADAGTRWTAAAYTQSLPRQRSA